MNKQPRRLKLNIEVPPELDATYANFALISHRPSEIVIDFARILPNTPKSRVHARIITTPMHAKMLLSALKKALEKYEAQYGEISLPSEGDDLVQQLFGTTKGPQQPES